MANGRRLEPGEPRSAGAIPYRRVPQAWPKDRRFRILCIDGGGIRGIFPAAVLAELEHRFTGGVPISSYFDLVAGTSTGGIIALGLGAGLLASELRDVYVERGGEVFPPLGRIGSFIRDKQHFVRYLYDRDALQTLLEHSLGVKRLGESGVRLCVPAFEGTHSEVYVYKTRHHPDFATDHLEKMVTVGLATAAAPSYFRPLEHQGFTLVDGGVWANNPIMLALVEALTSFDLSRDQIDILSLGCGDDRYTVSRAQVTRGGLWHWRNVIEAAMRLQSLSATNQARLLLGPPSVTRVDAPLFIPKIRMDDYARAVAELVPAAAAAVDSQGAGIAAMFLSGPAEKFLPLPAEV